MTSFGPNGSPAWLHHRCQEYDAHLLAIRTALRDKGLLEPSWSLLVMAGSGTLALEACAYSLGVDVQGDGEFAARWRAVAEPYGPGAWAGYVLYETAAAVPGVPPPAGRPVACDAVSGWPYYRPAGDAWVSVSAKQLCADPGLALIALSPEAIASLRDATPSYLSLRRWLQFGGTPHTPAMRAVLSLRSALEALDVAALRSRIDSRREMLMDACRSVGVEVAGVGPVLRLIGLPGILTFKWGLYRGRTRRADPEVFLWTGDDAEYERFAKEVKCQTSSAK